MVTFRKELDSQEPNRKGFYPDEFETQVKETVEALEVNKKKKKKDDNQLQNKQKSDEVKNEVDSDENLETYYNYCVNTISLFYLVVKVSIAFHNTFDLAIL